MLLHFKRDQEGQLYAYDNTYPLDIEVAKKTAEYLLEYVETMAPEKVERMQKEADYFHILFQGRGSYLLEKDYENDRPGTVFLCVDGRYFRLRYTQGDPNKKRKQIEKEGLQLLEEFQTPFVRTVYIYLTQVLTNIDNADDPDIQHWVTTLHGLPEVKKLVK